MSSPTATITKGARGEYKIAGSLVFATVRDVLKSSAEDFQNDKDLSIDLSGVDTVDSAGLALLIEWFRAAAKDKKNLRFLGAPAQLKALAKISEIDTVLPFA